MYKNILIATDGSELAEKAIVQGLALAKVLRSKVVVITVTEQMVISSPLALAEYEKAMHESAQKLLARISKDAKQKGVECETVHIRDTYPADAIIAEAEAKKCDLIVMSSHGRRGVTRLLLGSQALAVLTHSKIPVLICR